MNYLDKTDRGKLAWCLIFDAAGGKINDVEVKATGHSHRDKVMFCQGYVIGPPTLLETTRAFMNRLVATI